MKLFWRYRKKIALFFSSLMIFQLGYTPTALALTSGPSQPEMHSFQPAGVNDMVDLFTGDFSYNIPLFELPGPNGGYPFNLSYQSGISLDQEASWVGLGFNLNPGAINRQMRGLPDEFKGDAVYTKTSVKPSVTVGMGAGLSGEIFGGDMSINWGLSVRQNNYQGFGYSIDGSFGFGRTVGNGMGAGIGWDVSLDSREGIGVNPNLTLGNKIGEIGLGVAYNSRSGLSNLNFNARINSKDITLKGAETEVTVPGSPTFSSSLSLAHPGYTPQVTMPMRNANLSVTLKVGGAWWGIEGDAYVKGFYSEQWLKDNGKRIKSNAFGYMNYQFSGSDRDLLDFNREKDGIVSKATPNLAIPAYTYDIYSVTGQGIGAMYRAKRNDYGIVHDPKTVSKSTGFAAGGDGAPVLSHAGVNLSLNHSESYSGQWDTNNSMQSAASFTHNSQSNVFEPWYFKVHGEPASESKSASELIGGDNAVRVRLDGTRKDPVASSTLENKTYTQTVPSPELNKRSERGQVIQSITNAELLDNTGKEYINHFIVQYYDSAGSLQTFNRSNLPAHHPAGLTALTQEGLRYNYAIPAYNTRQEEVIFSAAKPASPTSVVPVVNSGGGDPEYNVPGTEEFLKSTEISPYAHSYLLTSILGPDYVDITEDGVTEDDLGYWVKFTYTKTTTDANPFKWRHPFSQAHYLEGWKTDPRDDKGQFTYGEKEIWYLTRAETKSHIAAFTLQDREDGRGVNQKLQDSNTSGLALKKLTEINLFTRLGGENKPIKKVKFNYDYSLCPGVYNNPAGQGKLTLKELWFEYGGSSKGSLNPYLFSYHQNNPVYDINASDRWGTYKPAPSGQHFKNIDFPYSEQNPEVKEIIDNNAAAWSLTRIQLPSGAEMLIDYETDDYAYVQHMPAMQMVPIVDPVNQDSIFNITDGNRKVRFRLEKPISGEQTIDQVSEVKKYLDDRDQVFFKIKINLRSPAEPQFQEYISGYADIDRSQPMGLEKDGSGNYVYGYFHLKAEDGKHPFSMRAWQHLRTNQPELASIGRKLKQTSNRSEQIAQIKSIASVFTQVRQMFEGFYSFCDSKGWGRQVEAEYSWIRLKSPDKIKYGGGLRVRQLTLKDNWQFDQDGVYGQVYDYTREENNAIISSGVAAFEPFIGGEENALRHAKYYTESIPVRSDNNLYFEYPVNESFYPGPQVGYSKVRVYSLPSAFRAGLAVNHIDAGSGKKIFPSDPSAKFGTSGMTENEFFTARDFPVITDETEKDDKSYQLAVPVPFLGTISVSKLASSQGYSIVNNDMSGKVKKVSNFRQNADGLIEDEPISYVRYNYLLKSRVYNQQNVFEVSNYFKENADGTLRVASEADLAANTGIYLMGQETEMFMDFREYADKTWGGGVNANVDILMIPIVFALVPIPVFTVWPSISKSSNELRTASVNKVIFKKGIVESIEAYDGGSVIKTQHLKWDKLTGTPVLSTVNNNFDQTVYRYDIQAYTQYQGMGAAYQNIGLRFTLNGVTKFSDKDPGIFFFTTTLDESFLFPGDELLLYANDGSYSRPLATAIFIGKEDGKLLIHSEKELANTDHDALIIRSGKRNQLLISAGNITALKDPSIKGAIRNFNKTIVLPNE